MRAVSLTLIAIACWALAMSAADLLDVRGRVHAKGRPLPNTVVWLDSLQATIAAPPAATLVLDQRNLAFSPQLLVVRVGATVAFPNNDRVFHNVFSFRDGKRFDLGMYPVGASRRVTFDKPGLSRLFCNIHPNMAAYVMTLDTPHFAVADAEGTFTIRAVPPATYTYHTWRAGGATSTGTFSPERGRQLEIEMP